MARRSQVPGRGKRCTSQRSTGPEAAGESHRELDGPPGRALPVAGDKSHKKGQRATITKPVVCDPTPAADTPSRTARVYIEESKGEPIVVHALISRDPADEVPKCVRVQIEESKDEPIVVHALISREPADEVPKCVRVHIEDFGQEPRSVTVQELRSLGPNTKSGSEPTAVQVAGAVQGPATPVKGRRSRCSGI